MKYFLVLFQTERPVCCGCRAVIQDRWMLHAGNQPYHLSCLRCCVCLFTLDKESSCFIRDGNVYCKYHYTRYNYVIIWAYVKLKSAFEHAQNASIQIILRMRKVSSGLLLSIHLFNYHVSGHWKLWWDCADAQADLCLRCPYMPRDTLSYDVAHLVIIILQPGTMCGVLTCTYSIVKLLIANAGYLLDD